jgi:D-galactarolactone cycloisomerase
MTSPKIIDLTCYPTSFRVPPENAVHLGIGRMVKRDAIIVKVTLDNGVTGWGEAHHGRSPGAVSRLIETSLKQHVINQDIHNIGGIWEKLYRAQVASHGLGAGGCLGISGIDMALWDARAKHLGIPLFQLLGGALKDVRAYAGGLSLGYQAPEALAAEAQSYKDQGYAALKLRIGKSVEDDQRAITGTRKNLGDSVDILVDANTAYSVSDVRAIMPTLLNNSIGWLEEPFPAYHYKEYQRIKPIAGLPIAAGENHYTRFEFLRLIEDGVVEILQPDLSKCGGITEALRISAMASAHGLPIHPHTSITGINMAASIHFLSAINNPGYFEADVSKNNLFRDELVHPAPFVISEKGTTQALSGPGIGVSVNEDFLQAHPLIEGPSYI